MQKYIILLFITTIYKTFGDIISVETCLNNFDKISISYWSHVRSYIIINKFLTHANRTLIQEVSHLNTDIDDGPVKCRRFTLNEKADYIDIMYEICGDVDHERFQEDPKILEEFKKVPHEFMQSNNQISRERYCPVTVKYLNAVTKLRTIVQNIVDALKRCRFLDRFDVEFRRPWAECAEGF